MPIQLIHFAVLKPQRPNCRVQGNQCSQKSTPGGRGYLHLHIKHPHVHPYYQAERYVSIILIYHHTCVPAHFATSTKMAFRTLTTIALTLCVAFNDVLAVTPSPGCGHNQASGTVSSTTTVNGKRRSYITNVPANYDSSNPYRLIFMFHGLGSMSSRYLCRNKTIRTNDYRIRQCICRGQRPARLPALHGASSSRQRRPHRCHFRCSRGAEQRMGELRRRGHRIRRSDDQRHRVQVLHRPKPPLLDWL